MLARILQGPSLLSRSLKVFSWGHLYLRAPVSAAVATAAADPAAPNISECAQKQALLPRALVPAHCGQDSAPTASLWVCRTKESLIPVTPGSTRAVEKWRGGRNKAKRGTKKIGHTLWVRPLCVARREREKKKSKISSSFRELSGCAKASSWFMAIFATIDLPTWNNMKLNVFKGDGMRWWDVCSYWKI